MLGDASRLGPAADEVKEYELSDLNGKLSAGQLDQVVEILRRASTGGELGQRAGRAVGEVVGAVASVTGQLAAVGDDFLEATGLGAWQSVFAGAEGDVYQRLLCLHVATWTIADESPTEASLPIDLVQVSLQTDNDFAVYSTTPDDKVGGLSLRRFGGFLKRSWRMNDWAWGRIDAATMLCQIILSPQRIQRQIIRGNHLQPDKQRAHEAAGIFVTDLVMKLFNCKPERLRIPRLTELMRDAADELVPLYLKGATGSQLPPSLPKLAAIAAWAVHLGIATKELPAIAAAVKTDRIDRANRYSRGELFVEQYADLLGKLQNTRDDQQLTAVTIDRGYQALQALDQAGIGREPISEEARSDQLIRTATTAASVAVTVADGSRSGLSAIKPVTRALRGIMLFPYWTVLGLASSGPIARFLALWLLGSGAVLLALPLLGVLHGWAAAPATAIGVSALVTAFGFAALRTGSLLHGIVLLTPLIPLITLAAERWHGQPREDGEIIALGTLGTILALALTLTLLGSIPSNLGTPLAALGNALDRTARRYLARYGPHVVAQTPTFRRRWETLVTWLSLTALKVAAVAGAGVVVYAGAIWVDDQASSWKTHHALLLTISAVLALLAWVLGFRAGWSYRLWSETSGVWRTRAVNLAKATAATWSVIYGTVFLAIATWLVWHWPSPSGWAWRAALMTAVVFALSLLYGVPLAVLLRSHGELRRRLVDDTRQGRICWPQPVSAGPPAESGRQHATAVIKLLHRQQLTYRCLVRAKRPCRDSTPDNLRVWFVKYVIGIKRPEVTEVVLTPAGAKLTRKVTTATAALQD
jgi:hypothetical protein